MTLWNNLDKDTQSITSYGDFKDVASDTSCSNSVFYVGNRRKQIIMARLRLRCRNLSSNLYALEIIEPPACMCGFVNEDEFHLFLICPLYNSYSLRVALQNVISDTTALTLKTLLYGPDEVEQTKNIEVTKIKFEICERLKTV